MEELHPLPQDMVDGVFVQTDDCELPPIHAGCLTRSELPLIHTECLARSNSDGLTRSNSVMDDREYAKRQLEKIIIKAEIPRMRDVGPKSGTTFSSARHDAAGEGRSLPYLAYAHGEGDRKNLPGHAEFIRILFEISKNNSNNGKNSNGELTSGDISNDWLALYTIERPRQRDRTRARMSTSKVQVCSFCQEKDDKHKKWCVNFVAKPIEDPYSNMKRSKTDISEFFKRPKKVKPVVVVSPPPPYKQYPLRPADYPDYSGLHREVYEHTLAVTRARKFKRLARKNRFVLERQLTDPFIYSYMNAYGTRDKDRVKKGMEHIFGEKHTDFTKQYEYSVKRIKEKKK